MHLTYPPSFLGVENVTTITIENIGTTASGAVVRTTGTDTSGFGMFGLLTFVVDPSATNLGTFNLDFANYLAVDVNGDSVLFNLESDSIIVNPSVGIIEFGENKILVYPNPATDVLNILWSNNLSNQNTQINVYDFTGRKISSDVISGIQNQFQLNTTQLASGNYLIQINY